jgi:hypothetical protein
LGPLRNKLLPLWMGRLNCPSSIRDLSGRPLFDTIAPRGIY